MNKLRELSNRVREILQAKGVEEYSFELRQIEKKELNTENTAFSLYRTVFDDEISVDVLVDGRLGSSSGSDLTDEGIEKTVENALQGAASGMADAANSIAEKQAEEVFISGTQEADMELFYTRLSELLSTVEREYPQIKVLQLIADHTKTHRLYANSNGTLFESYDGLYSVMMEYAGNDGEKTTGLSYGGASTHELTKPLIELGAFRKNLEDAVASLNLTSFEGKFEGTVIFTPDCLGMFLFMLSNNYLMSQVVMDGTSQWLDRVGEQVSSDKVTFSLKAEDERLVETEPYTADGYKAENVPVIEKGILKNQILSLYAAKKTGRPVTKNTSRSLVMEPGDKTLSEMIASVKRGLIVGGFSGGRPGVSGDFSGVAKNSFYIEDGKIKGAVNETMINGNLAKVFQNVTAVSKELCLDGSSALPYLQTEGIVISGK
ncbi:MAG: TldD/PmbA family protein [Firmicutes bacterium]|nr:TldD/PmbA family protein [Bacillota bacterium]